MERTFGVIDEACICSAGCTDISQDSNAFNVWLDH